MNEKKMCSWYFECDLSFIHQKLISVSFSLTHSLSFTLHSRACLIKFQITSSPKISRSILFVSLVCTNFLTVTHSFSLSLFLHYNGWTYVYLCVYVINLNISVSILGAAIVIECVFINESDHNLKVTVPLSFGSVLCAVCGCVSLCLHMYLSTYMRIFILKLIGFIVTTFECIWAKSLQTKNTHI